MTLTVEGATGEAIEVFWKAPKVLSRFAYDGWTRKIDSDVRDAWLIAEFEPYLDDFFARMCSMRDYLGADWLSLEGYAGPSAEQPLFIADLDIPLDSALVGSERSG
jgi:hypothetical protein